MTLDGKSIRSWEYHHEADRRHKLHAAREYVEGFYAGQDTWAMTIDEVVPALRRIAAGTRVGPYGQGEDVVNTLEACADDLEELLKEPEPPTFDEALGAKCDAEARYERDMIDAGRGHLLK